MMRAKIQALRDDCLHIGEAHRHAAANSVKGLSDYFDGKAEQAGDIAGRLTVILAEPDDREAVIEECCKLVCVHCAKNKAITHMPQEKQRHERFVHETAPGFVMDCRAWAIREHFWKEGE